MLVPIFAEAFRACGLTRRDIGFWCSGSSDYLAGRAFSFVSAVDAIGAVPPTMESHVEMDAAWALYEAWAKVLTGEAEIALAYGFGKSSGAELRRVLALQLDPYLLAPLWPDSVSVAALQARLGLEAGRWTEKDMAEVVARSRAAALSNPDAQVSGSVAASGLLARRRCRGQPVGRRAVRQPDVRGRAGADRAGGAGGHVRPGRARARARDQRPGSAAEPGVRPVRGGVMKRPAAVLGVGQTRHRSKRTDVSIAGLCREAADRALADAGLSLADVDAVVVGKAPDLFEGVMMPELYLADALGAVGKPLLRVHTAGSVGGATGIVATSLVEAGRHRRVLAVAFEKQSESNAMWALSITPPFSMPVLAGAGGYFAPHIRSYIRRSGAPGHIGAMVAVKDRRNGSLNPYAHLQQADITLESVRSSPMLWDPVRYDETCPSSDGACAVVIGDQAAAAAAQSADRPVAWIRATSMR